MRQGNRLTGAAWGCLALVCAGLACTGPARGNWEVDGLNGGIAARGSLVSQPCRLSPESVEQEMSLGQIALWSLERPGSVSLPVTLQLVLEACPAGPSWLASPQRQQGELWLSGQHGMAMTLTGDADPTDGRYFRLRGSGRGVALRLEDDRGEWLQPGLTARPRALSPGRNVVPLKAQLWRTSAPLQAGEFYGVVNVNMEYE
ncbi:type 1 fimbrial protein [Enterobacter sp. Acro-832]|uniref:fimbrial protein n=1 Tax=Enterobacter sp. Acro-832 TaxID=2608348 RepID=UPI0014205D26|nr:fimbrial protein [Enterobacter sp. Acro-832]NIG46417.1 type 1 fimbrial protein [Enterobacter sp. Acro-832]